MFIIENVSGIAVGKSSVTTCVDAAEVYGLTEAEARTRIDRHIEVVRRDWDEVCDDAQLAHVDRDYFWERQFLNDYAFEGY